jgi:hypothetical protein
MINENDTLTVFRISNSIDDVNSHYWNISSIEKNTRLRENSLIILLNVNKLISMRLIRILFRIKSLTISVTIRYRIAEALSLREKPLSWNNLELVSSLSRRLMTRWISLYYTNTRYVDFVLISTSRSSCSSSAENSSLLSRHDSKSFAEDIINQDKRRLVLLTWARKNVDVKKLSQSVRLSLEASK